MGEMKKHTELYIYHNLGLGDHIICNSIVRHYAKLYDKIYLFVKNHNYISVKFMYQDLDNIVFIVGQVYSDGIDTFVLPYIEKYQDKILRIGYKDIGLSFDEYFYYSNGISFEKRWSDFYVDRNPYSEMEIFNKFNVHEDYIFLHEDVNRNYIIDRNNIINKDLRIISPIEGLTDNIFDYCYLLENAKEVHCIDSSFRLLADSINLKTLDLFYHINRNQDDKLYSSSLKNWKKILY